MPPAPTIVYRTTDPLKWGTGKEAPLSAEEFDENYWALVQALAAVSALEPHEIQDISVTPEGQMTILLDGGATFGPFTLPVASLNFRDTWQPATNYTKNDYFSEADGLYLVLLTHTSDGVFSPSAGSGLGPYYKLIMPSAKAYDIGFFYPGAFDAVTPEDAMFGYVAVRDFYLPAGLTASRAALSVAPDSDMDMLISKAGTGIGTVNFAAGETTATFVLGSDVQFSAGDVLTVALPSATDPTAKTLSLTLAARFGAMPEPTST